MTWTDHQAFERDWHGDCIQVEFGERLKQTVYARKMGLRFEHDGKSPFSIDMGGQKVLEVGGGPYAMLLFCRNVRGTVVDPCSYPDWVYARYEAAGIDIKRIPAEDMVLEGYGQCWIANCLQHVQDPKEIIKRARQAASIVRVFEWVNHGVSPGHGHNLEPDLLNKWLDGEGKVENIDESGCKGLCYYGVFKGS